MKNSISAHGSRHTSRTALSNRSRHRHVRYQQKVWPKVTGDFQHNRDKNVNLYFQVYSLKVDEGTKKPPSTLEIALTRNNQEVKKIIEPSSDLAIAAS
jgi:hypothetical protein